MDEDCQGDFSPQLFAGRKTELKELIRWATAKTVPRRLKTIVAPPGYGKSWLLCQFKKRLSARNCRELFFIHVPTPKREDQRLKSRDDIMVWLSKVWEEAQKCCQSMRDYDPALPVETVIARLLEDLCQNCNLTLQPIVIVDSFDELPPNEREILQKHLLEEFWRNECVKIAIAFRDELSLNRPTLRRGEERLYLKIFEPQEGQDQLQKRAEKFQEDSIISPQALRSLIPPYDWTHPKLNTGLYEAAHEKAQNQQPLSFTPAELNNCWVSLIETKAQDLSMDLSIIEGDLKAIASSEIWTVEIFAQICGYSLSEAYQHIADLMALTLVSHEKQNYKVVDGIRELIQAEIVL